jgi:hypothetical protein
MSQNNQNRFAALSPSQAAAQPKKGGKKKGQSHDDGEEPLLDGKCPTAVPLTVLLPAKGGAY